MVNLWSSFVYGVKNQFDRMSPTGVGVTIIAMIPIVSNIFLALKESRCFHIYKENRQNSGDTAINARQHMIKLSERLMLVAMLVQGAAALTLAILIPYSLMATTFIATVYLAGQTHHLWVGVRTANRIYWKRCADILTG